MAGKNKLAKGLPFIWGLRSLGGVSFFPAVSLPLLLPMAGARGTAGARYDVPLFNFNIIGLKHSIIFGSNNFLKNNTIVGKESY